MRARAPVTRAILAVIAVVFLAEFFAPEAMLENGGIVPGMLARHEYWRLITSMFLHAPPVTWAQAPPLPWHHRPPFDWLGWGHWLANSWALFQLGTLYEILFGSKRFAFVYFATGICAGIASSFHIESVGVGASGAIFGLLGAFVFSIWRSPRYRHEPWTRGLLKQIIFWTVVNLYIGFQFPFIDNVAHIGGLVTGLLLGLIPHRLPPPPPGSSVIDVQPYEEGGP